MNRKILKFRLFFKLVGLPPFMETLDHLNSVEWLGREPQTCKILSLHQQSPVAVGEQVEFEILVEYRPVGCITSNYGGFWYDGWKIKNIDMKRDGTLLDGHGNPLSVGENPVVLEWNAYKSIDYNDYEWGELIDEVTCPE